MIKVYHSMGVDEFEDVEHVVEVTYDRLDVYKFTYKKTLVACYAPGEWIKFEKE